MLFIKRTIIILGILITLILSGCSSQKNIDNSNIAQYNYDIELRSENTETIYLDTPLHGKELASLEDYIKPLEDWIEENPNKTILNVTNLPAQTGVTGLFVTYKKEKPKSEYKVVGYKYSDFRNHPVYKEDTFPKDPKVSHENIINFVSEFSRGLNIISATTINAHRGGIAYIIFVVEDK